MAAARARTRKEPEAAQPAARIGRPRNATLDVAILKATRRHLVSRGYSQLSITEVAAEAGVSRPTVYRRWRTKLELVHDALDYGLEAQNRKYAAAGDPLALPPKQAFTEAIRRVDPCWANPDAIVLQGNIIGETSRSPELITLTAERAVNPRVERLETVLIALRDRGFVRTDVDLHTIATMCFGAFFGAHLRGERDRAALVTQLSSTLWTTLAPSSRPSTRRRAAANRTTRRT